MGSNKGYTTTDGIDLNEILYGTLLPILDVYNLEETLDLRALLCHDADEGYVKFDTSGHWKFQRLAEAEKPRSRKRIYGKRQKDCDKFGLNVGYTYDWLMSDLSSAAEISKMANKAITRDRALQTAVILDACLKNGTDGFFNGAFSTEENMTAPPTFGAQSFTAAHTHYVASGSTTLALSVITSMKEHVKEHGFGGNMWGFCNADTIKKIEDLAGWAALSSTTFIVPTKVVDDISIDGFQGRLLGIDWKETQWMPDGYVMIIGDAGQAEKPVRFIQKKNPSAHGLILTPGSYDPRYPIIDADYLHWLNAQVLHRPAGVVYYLGTTWANPDVLTNVIE